MFPSSTARYCTSDQKTGQVTKLYLFVGVLPYSGAVFCRGFTDMKSPSWIDAHVAAFDFFGGTPQMVVPDNPTTATHRQAKGEAARAVNVRYQQLADHYGTAIVPARVRKPRDYPGDFVIPSRDREVLVGAGSGCFSSG